MSLSDAALAPSLAPQRILAVDDDPQILKMISLKLEMSGFEVMTAVSGKEALEVIARRGLPHLALIDLSMPGMTGFELCAALEQFSDLPIIMVTAMSDEETVIRGIEQYAEDYITKPFSLRELVARVQRVLRRVGDFGYALAPVIRVDDFLSVDYAHQAALVGGERVALTPLETKLLYILMRNAGRVVTSDFIVRRLWPLEEMGEDSLRVHVHNLRKKIERAPAKAHYILNERGVGYKFPAQR
jgi:DNA-binding response OmpR family regulator